MRERETRISVTYMEPLKTYDLQSIVQFQSFEFTCTILAIITLFIKFSVIYIQKMV